MNDLLFQYLVGLTTYENAQFLTDTNDLLTEIGYHTHEDDIDRIVTTSDNHETMDNLSSIVNVLSTYTVNAVEEFGVTLEDPIELTIAMGILSGLFAIENYGDPEHIYHIVNQDDSDEVVLSDILNVTSPIAWYEIENNVINVVPTLVTTIRQLTATKLEEEPEVYNVSDEKRQRFLRFADINKDLFAWQALREGTSFGTSLDNLLLAHEEALLEITTKPQRLSEELLGLVLISDVKPADEIDVIKMLLDDLMDDINAISVVFKLTTEHLKELD